MKAVTWISALVLIGLIGLSLAAVYVDQQSGLYASNLMLPAH